MEEETSRGWRRLFKRLRSHLVFTRRTRVFNSFFFLPQYGRALKIWFDFGVLLGLLVAAVSVWVLAWQVVLSVQSLFFIGSVKPSIITPAVPGMNFPWSHLLYLVLGTSLAVVFHELGHGLAAGSEGVPVDHVAVFLVLCFPGAYVALSQDALDLLPLSSLLRIYCAGIWHNVVLCAGCWLSLKAIPFLVLPLYIHGVGPVVQGVSLQSPLVGYLAVGDTIKAINEIPVHSMNDLVRQVQSNRQVGYCVPLDIMYTAGSKCDAAVLELQSLDSSGVGCLHASDLLKFPFCESPNSCSELSECMVPSLPSGEALLRISFAPSGPCSLVSADEIKGGDCEKVIHFAGRPEALLYSIQLRDYIPRRGCIPKSLPSLLEKFLAYTINISAALALVNSAPVYYLDGEEILRSLLRLLPRHKRKKILTRCLTAGSSVFVLGLFLSVRS